jgi:hypothetical protein
MKRLSLLILAGIGGLTLLLALLAVLFATLVASPEDHDFNIKTEVSSPDGVFQATHFVGMGGGAAGWCQEVVTVRPSSSSTAKPKEWERDFKVFSVSCGSNVQVRWVTSSQLYITFSIKGRSGGASAYLNSTNNDGRVHVQFNTEA